MPINGSAGCLLRAGTAHDAHTQRWIIYMLVLGTPARIFATGGSHLAPTSSLSLSTSTEPASAVGSGGP